MNTFTWILVGLIGVCLTLYFVFTFAKKITLIQKISSSVLIPTIGTLYIYFLLSFLPDSSHTIRLSFLSLIFLTISWGLKNFLKGQGAILIQRITAIFAIIPIAFLYKSVFLIHRVPLFINIIATCTYTILFFLFFIIFIKKSSLSIYSYSITTILISSFVHYCCLLTLCYLPTTYTIIRFIGSTGILAYFIFGTLNDTIINLKLKKLISLMILLASLVLLCLSNLMVWQSLR